VPRIRLASFISVVPTTDSLHLQSDLRNLQIDTSHLEFLTEEILPLLDGSRDKEGVVAAVKGYSRRSVLKFLNSLEAHGLLETVPDEDDLAIDLDRQEQQEFFHAWTKHPEEMARGLKEYKRLISKWVDARTGIIKYLTTEPPDPANFNFVWTSAAVMARSRRAEESSLKTTGFGVGVTSVEAMAKAVAEALELYASSRCSENELAYSSAGTLSEDFLDPRQLYLYDRAQYEGADFPFERFHSRSRIAWTRGQWLDTGAEVWLPAFLTYFGADVSRAQNFAQVTTSGLATSRSLEDASMHAVCELVERDAFMITWLAQVPARRLIPDSVDQTTREIINGFETHGREMRFYLLSVGVDVPVVLCLIRGDGKNWPGATVGLGAHANPVIATRKAILEQALIGPSMRREMLAGQRRIPRRANQIITPLDHALYYVPKQRARALDFLESEKLDPVLLSQLPPPKTISLGLYVSRLQDAGVRVAIKDLTPPDVRAESPFRIVRALGTSLQPIHFGFGLSRSASPRLRRWARNGLNSHPHPLA
jgi:ribosomal protein S12 methylthiotransferase accessory factor